MTFIHDIDEKEYAAVLDYENWVMKLCIHLSPLKSLPPKNMAEVWQQLMLTGDNLEIMGEN